MENNNSSLGTLSAHTNSEVESKGFDADKFAKDLLRQSEEELREFMQPIHDQDAEVKAMLAKQEAEVKEFMQPIYDRDAEIKTMLAKQNEEIQKFMGNTTAVA